jgi:hypothetical protein
MMSFSAMSSMAGSLPPNARYVTHRNECYDWGTLGWLLTTKQVTRCRHLADIFTASVLPVFNFIPVCTPCAEHHDDSSARSLLHAP